MGLIDGHMPIRIWIAEKLGLVKPPSAHHGPFPYKVPHWSKYKVGDHTVRFISAALCS